MRFHVTHKDKDVRSSLLFIWQHCVSGKLGTNVVVTVHSDANDIVRWQCDYFGRMEPPFIIQIHKNKAQSQIYYNRGYVEPPNPFKRLRAC
jgi:hypothetical protein